MNLTRLAALVLSVSLIGCTGFKKTVGLCTCHDEPEAAEVVPAEETPAANAAAEPKVSKALPVMFMVLALGTAGYLVYIRQKNKK
jgi:hypothetical protein